MNKNLFSARYFLDARMSDDIKAEHFGYNRRKFGSDLFEKLLEYPSPVIVDVSEEYNPDFTYMPTDEKPPFQIEHRISVKIQSIQRGEVIIMTPKYISRRATFIEKIKWLLS